VGDHIVELPHYLTRKSLYREDGWSSKLDLVQQWPEISRTNQIRSSGVLLENKTENFKIKTHLVRLGYALHCIMCV
jgi:ribonuclease BN (tRNA processing enzyme)